MLLVSKAWRIEHQGTNMYKVTRKLKHVKRELKEWAKHDIDNSYNKLSKNAKNWSMLKKGLWLNHIAIGLILG